MLQQKIFGEEVLSKRLWGNKTIKQTSLFFKKKFQKGFFLEYLARKCYESSEYKVVKLFETGPVTNRFNFFQLSPVLTANEKLIELFYEEIFREVFHRSNIWIDVFSDRWIERIANKKGDKQKVNSILKLSKCVKKIKDELREENLDKRDSLKVEKGRGWPDFFVFKYNSMGQIEDYFFVEVKTNDWQLNSNQKKKFKELLDTGYKIEIFTAKIEFNFKFSNMVSKEFQLD